MSGRPAPLALVASVLVLTATGCGGAPPGATPVPRASSTSSALTALDRAIAGFDAARGSALAGVVAVAGATARLDSFDRLAGAGRRGAAEATRPVPTASLSARQDAIGRFGAAVAAERRAVARLGPAAAALPAAARAAVSSVATAAAGEVAALARFAASAASAGPLYAALAADETSWLDHAVAGWFASAADASAAYLPSIDPIAVPLQAARAHLAAADAARVAADARLSAALTAANAALAPYRRSPVPPRSS